MVLMSCGLTLSGILLILVTFWSPNRLLGYFDPTWTPHVAPGLEKYRFLMVFGPHLGGHLAPLGVSSAVFSLWGTPGP